jgi:hypothetical protein
VKLAAIGELAWKRISAPADGKDRQRHSAASPNQISGDKIAGGTNSPQVQRSSAFFSILNYAKKPPAPRRHLQGGAAVPVISASLQGQ